MFRTITTTLSALFAAVTLLSASAVHADPLYFAGPNPTANRPSVTPPGQVAINTAPGAPIYVGPGGSGPAVAPVAAPPSEPAGRGQSGRPVGRDLQRRQYRELDLVGGQT
jgi:hypothetical protein